MPSRGTMAIVDLIAALYRSSKRELEGRETILEAKVSSQELQALDMVADSEGSVSFEGPNPYGGTYLDGEDDPENAARLLEKRNEEFDGGSRSFGLTLEFVTGLTGETGDIVYELSDGALDMEGTVAADVEPDEVENTVAGYGVDRYTDGWEFGSLSLDEFQEDQETYEPTMGEVQEALMQGSIQEAGYGGKDYSEEEGTEAVLELLNEDKSIQEITVENIPTDTGHKYNVSLVDVSENVYELEIKSDSQLFQRDDSEPKQGSSQVETQYNDQV